MGQLTVGLIDDHPLMQEALVALLTRSPDYKLVAVGKTKDLLEIVKRDRPDVMIVDPGVSGDVLRTISAAVKISPSTKLIVFGGSTSIDRSAVGQDVDQDGSVTTRVATDFQESISSDYHSPFSLAFGGARSFGRTRVHLSAEWFDGVGLSSILTPEPFVAQSSG